MLPAGQVARKFLGLLDREFAMEDLYAGPFLLAGLRAKTGLDKNDVPALGLSAPSKADKTEFLRSVFNSGCTFSSKANVEATHLFEGINKASSDGVSDLDNLLVLMASFNHESPYSMSEGPIVAATVRRLARSYKGTLDLHDSLTTWSNLLDAFAKDTKTGIIAL